MKLHFDPDACQGHGRCYALAPELFDCDDEGFAVLKADGERPELAARHERAARLAADSCPELAITVD